MTTPGIPSSALTPRNMHLDQIGWLGQAQRAVEREVRPDRKRRVTGIVVTGRAGRRVEPCIGIELLPGAGVRVGHRTRYRCIGGRQAIARMVDVGKIGRECLDVRFRKRGKTAARRETSAPPRSRAGRSRPCAGNRRAPRASMARGQGLRPSTAARSSCRSPPRRRRRPPFPRRAGCAACGRRRNGLAPARGRRRGSIRRSCPRTGFEAAGSEEQQSSSLPAGSGR